MSSDHRSAPGGRLHVGFVLTALAGGGAERVTLTLAGALIRLGHRVDLLLLRPFGSYHASIPRGVQLYYLPTRKPARRLLLSCRERAIPVRRLWVGPLAVARVWSALRRNYPRTWTRVGDVLKEVLCVAGIERYARAAQPMLLYGTSVWCNIGVVLAASLPTCAVAAVASVHSVVFLSYTAAELARARLLYPAAHGVVAVCPSVGAEVERAVGVPRTRLHQLPNPIPVEQIRRLSRHPVQHPWFDDAAAAEVPVLLTVGRPVPLKDHATLVAAFARIRRQRSVRLVIMGGGAKSYRARLRAAAGGAAQDLDFLDFDENPYRYLRRARVLVLSSRHEACPTVLVEAMACDTAVVSTDAPHGPADLLGGGRWGKLVPVGDPDALADAVIDVLDGDTVPAPELRRRAQEFAVDRVAAAYAELFEKAVARRRA